jgi:ADP-ribose pyrophosphatase YjhB (NUDIX family)
MNVPTSLAETCTQLEGWDAPNSVQAATRDRIVEFVREHPCDANLRTCLEGHLTGSSLMVDASRTHVLLNHHLKLDKWLQFGGHADGDPDIRNVALRELIEESGIEPAWFSPAAVDLDIHSIPERGAEPEHLHLDVRYLAIAPEGAQPKVSHESKEIRWVPIGEIDGLELDESVTRLIDLVPTLTP